MAKAFEDIMGKFEGSPSQQAVIRLLLERGFSVNDDGRVVSGSIEIPNTQIARELDIDRRVVDSTTDAILADDELKQIFQNISSIPSLRDLAPVLDLHVLTMVPTDADQPGIVATLTDDPKLYIVTEEPLPGDLINEMMELPFVRKVELE